MQSQEHERWFGRTVSTANLLGRTSTVLNEVNELFIEWSARSVRPVLDIGCAYGTVALAALERGATVIANDLDARHLEVLQQDATKKNFTRLRTILGRFPEDLHFDEGSLAAIHASNVLNFLTGPEIDAGVHRMFDWLVPGGKVFVIAGTPYAANIRGFISTYERRRSLGFKWPGECERLSKYSDDATVSELPSFLHLLDDEVLRRSFTEAGFVVEEVRMFHRRSTPQYIAYDGRENVLLVARKELDQVLT